MNFPRLRTILALLLLLLLPWHRRADAYSLLTHEQLIDLTWQDSIVPLLLSHYPNLTPAQLEEARAYAYGGCVIQDIGYYPFGDPSFSNLTHYVRTGDFVLSLFRNAGNADELAFAVGALSHYIGDSIGHAQATNRAVPIQFPKLGAKYGNIVNYAQGEHQHVQIEFAFDIDEIAHRRLAPLQFLRHVGIMVPVRQLALAYYQTYGLTVDFTATSGRRFNMSGYTFATRDLIPHVAYALTYLHRDDEPPEPATPERLLMDKEVARIAAENNWQAYRRKAGFETHFLAVLIFIAPKFGPFAMVAIKNPTQATEADYLHSVVLSTTALRQRLARFTPSANTASTAASAASPGTSSQPPPAQPPRPSQNSSHPLPNRDLDTGQVVQPGGYPLTDATYADLLHRLTRTPARPIPPGIKEDIQTYYANLALPITTKKNPAAWAQVQADLVTLAAMPTTTEPEPYPTYGENPDSTP
jgi:hypothetical protein